MESLPVGESKMPIVGLGTWKTSADIIKQSVRTALAAGYRHIDCAAAYGNEKWIGEVFAENFAAGTLKREDIFVTSKLWNCFHAKELVKPALQSSLKDLGLDYLDLYLIHWPIDFAYVEGNLFPKNEDGSMQYGTVHFTETWLAMEELVKEGLVKNIGLSNFNQEQIQEVLAIATIRPTVLQVECHPFLPQLELSKFCKELGITFTAYSPLGSPDRPWAKPDDIKLLDHPEILALAAKHGKTAAQILIRYQIDRGHSVIPKSATPERIEANLKVLDFKLTEEEIHKLHTEMPRVRFCVPTVEKEGKVIPRDSVHPLFPFKDEFQS